MGKGGKGGGGGGQAPQVNIPAGLSQAISGTTGLGQFGSSLLNSISSMTNWAANQASGGRTTPIPSFQSVAQQAGPQVNFGGQGQLWNTSFDPTTGLVTFTNSKNPQQTWQTGVTSPSLTGVLDPTVQKQWMADAQQSQTAGGTQPPTTWEGVGQALGLSPSDIAKFQKQGMSPQQVFNQFQSGIGSNLQSSLGPYLGKAWSAIQQAQDLTKQMAPIQAETAALGKKADIEGTQLFGEGENILGTGTSMISGGNTWLNQARAETQALEKGSGLFPGQEALVKQDVATEKTNLETTLQGMGLGRSTQLAELTGEADLAGAAEAGKLTQGNIQLSQAEEAAAQKQVALGEAEQAVGQHQIELSQGAQKIALGAQELSMGEQAALFSEFKDVSQLSSQLQKDLWTEAMQGYGMIGNIINASAQSYGYSISGYQAMIQAESAQAQAQAGIQEANIKAASQANSDMFSALGSLLSSGGGGGGSSGGGGGSSGGSTIGSIIGIVGTVLSFL